MISTQFRIIFYPDGTGQNLPVWSFVSCLCTAAIVSSLNPLKIQPCILMQKWQLCCSEMLMLKGEGCSWYLGLTGVFVMFSWAPVGLFGGNTDRKPDIGKASLYMIAPLKLCSLLPCLQCIWVLWFFLMWNTFNAWNSVDMRVLSLYEVENSHCHQQVNNNRDEKLAMKIRAYTLLC